MFFIIYELLKKLIKKDIYLFKEKDTYNIKININECGRLDV
jgi:hypothetical protein